MSTRRLARWSLLTLAVVVLAGAAAPGARAGTLTAPFADDYVVTDLGSITGLPTPYGGLTLLGGTTDTLLIGGDANTPAGALYTVGVTRDGGGHITGFTGPATYHAEAAYNDGGVTYGPGGVLFLARWPENEIGQIKPGSFATDKIIDLAPLGVAESGPGGLSFVPTGFPGAGGMKIVAWPGGEFYDLTFSPDGAGTYDITGATLVTTLPGGPEGFAYIAAGNPEFGVASMLVSEYSAGVVAAYDLDAAGNPILATRREFMSGLTGAEGAFVDPVTGDYIFSTFGGADTVVVVSGFTTPPPSAAVPLPSAAWAGLGLLSLLGAARLRRKRGELRR